MWPLKDLWCCLLDFGKRVHLESDCLKLKNAKRKKLELSVRMILPLVYGVLNNIDFVLSITIDS